jgi:FMN phosphatase YigB (HAD superfamily)
MGLRPQEAVYVGDDWRIDICGARDAGLKPVWIKHHSVHRNWPDVGPFEPTITRLDDLLLLPI